MKESQRKWEMVLAYHKIVKCIKTSLTEDHLKACGLLLQRFADTYGGRTRVHELSKFKERKCWELSDAERVKTVGLIRAKEAMYVRN